MEENLVTMEEMKKQNPEKYFQEVLEVAEFEKLKELVIKSLWAISWETLIKEDIVKIEDRKIEGIYWRGNLNISRTKIKSLRKIKEVEGNLFCEVLKDLESLGELEEVGGDFLLGGTSIKTFGKLKKVGCSIDCRSADNLEEIGDLEEVGGNLDLRNIKNIKTLGKLKRVDGFLYCDGMDNLEDLGKLEEVGGFLCIENTKIKTLGKLKIVGGDLICTGVKTLENLENLEEVGKYVYLSGTSIETLGKLKKIGGGLTCCNIPTLKSLGELLEIGVDLHCWGTSIKSLGKLRRIGGNLNCLGLKSLEDLGDLREVRGTINIKGTKVKTLRTLEKVGYLDLVGGLIDLQIEIITLLKSKEIIIKDWVLFGGEGEILNKLLDQEVIPGVLSLKEEPIYRQMEILIKKTIGELLIDDLELKEGVEDMYNKLYKNSILNLDMFQEVFGEDINKIRDVEFRVCGINLIIREYTLLKEKLIEKIKKLRIENEGKVLTNDKQKELRKKILKLTREFQRKKEYMEGLGVKLEHL